MESLDHEITYLSILFKCYSPFSSQTTPPFSMTFGYQLHCIVSIKKLALVQVNIDRKLQGCKVPLILVWTRFQWCITGQEKLWLRVILHQDRSWCKCAPIILEWCFLSVVSASRRYGHWHAYKQQWFNNNTTSNGTKPQSANTALDTQFLLCMRTIHLSLT